MSPLIPIPHKLPPSPRKPLARKLAGYFNLYWDAKQGKLWLEIDKWSSGFLYQSGLSAGVGSNDIGLDRGQLGETPHVSGYPAEIARTVDGVVLYDLMA